jgi:Spy/CpxP family protein refolding chaperone
METTKARGAAAVLVVVVFLLGALLGGVGMHLWGERTYGGVRMPGMLPPRNQMVSDMTRELQLTPDQQKQLATIIDETRAQVLALYAPLDSQHEQIRQHGRDRVRAILTPEQLPKFEQFIQRIDEKRKKDETH